MRYVEYGKENNKVILLLHGGGLSWWNYEEAAKSLQKDYHVILPILDGHAGSDKSFTSIEDNATEIIDFIDIHFEGTVLFIGGLSLGGQILLEILSQRSDICKYAIIESALVIPSKVTYSMIKPAFGSCYGLIHNKWFSKLQFKSLKIKPNLFDCYFRDTCAISKKEMISFLQANSLYSLKDSIRRCTVKVHVFVGEKENTIMKKSAKIIHQALQESTLYVLPKLYHGEFSINQGKDYANKIREITGS
ncbi:MAG: alpha/beta hydrolase [Erysipelotrichaceae bacterium]|nr:alpha/beta hydrolase [Erysipelotrichaceae bacterium]